MQRFRRLLFDSCRSNDDAVIPPLGFRNAPVVSFSSCNFRCTSVPRRNTTVVADVAADDLSLARETPAYLWRKEEKWHVVAYDEAASTSPRSKIDSHFADDGILFPSMLAARRKSKVGRGGWFSSDDEGEKTLMSSSSESKEFAVEAAGKAMRESTAVVKRSEDPRRDFRRSMVEMVVEKGMYDADELEELLQCFLSLNSRHHHVAIVAAFADVWEALFSDDSAGCR
ncbi:hypothetical protein IEQ34_021678 [Dendrobium chrysotoxum]|uniref:Transcription repressor n=1 Tax=Dendrobium chrysotoxum TaxID=161865 RepID=A0AAV7G3R1_DENCH|nr:hypothetical protein IEQ34_021678 [Dendrobium chrysotoxum]